MVPDITMCVNSGCGLRGECYRYRAIPHPYRQSYAEFRPEHPEECSVFLPVQSQSRLLPTEQVDQIIANSNPPQPSQYENQT